MFEELLNRFVHFELDGPLAWMNNNRLASLTELPVKAFPLLKVHTKAILALFQVDNRWYFLPAVALPVF